MLDASHLPRPAICIATWTGIQGAATLATVVLVEALFERGGRASTVGTCAREWCIQQRAKLAGTITHRPIRLNLNGIVIARIDKHLCATGLEEPRQEHIQRAKAVQSRMRHRMSLQVQATESAKQALEHEMPEQLVLCTFDIHSHDNDIARKGVLPYDLRKVDSCDVREAPMALVMQEQTILTSLAHSILCEMKAHFFPFDNPCCVGVEDTSLFSSNGRHLGCKRGVRLHEHRPVRRAVPLAVRFQPGPVFRCRSDRDEDMLAFPGRAHKQEAGN